MDCLTHLQTERRAQIRATMQAAKNGEHAIAHETCAECGGAITVEAKFAPKK